MRNREKSSLSVCVTCLFVCCLFMCGVYAVAVVHGWIVDKKQDSYA